MSDLDPTDLPFETEDVGAKKVKQKKGNFSSKGPNWVHSRDRDDKLMDHQNSTFRGLSIQQKFWFKISEISRAQWNGTFQLHRPDPSHHGFGYCPCKQDTKERY